MLTITPQSLAQEAINKWHVDPARMQKAVEIVMNRYQIYNQHCPEGEYDVRSQNVNAWYHVNTKKHTCTCPDSQKGYVCKHRLAVWLYVEIQRRTVEAIRQDVKKYRQQPTATAQPA